MKTLYLIGGTMEWVKLENTESYRCMGEVWNCMEMEMMRYDK